VHFDLALTCLSILCEWELSGKVATGPEMITIGRGGGAQPVSIGSRRVRLLLEFTEDMVDIWVSVGQGTQGRE
jgi:hypothetical protein